MERREKIMAEEGSKSRREQKVAFYKLFSFADQLDVVLMVIGTIGGIANGLCQPLMTLIFGQLINSFGTSDNATVVHQVSKVLSFPFFVNFALFNECHVCVSFWPSLFVCLSRIDMIHV